MIIILKNEKIKLILYQENCVRQIIENIFILDAFL